MVSTGQGWLRALLVYIPDLSIQHERLRSIGCTIRSEKLSGASLNGRDQLSAIMEFIREGDELVIVKLDRLGRNTRDVLSLVHELQGVAEHKCRCVSLLALRIDERITAMIEPRVPPVSHDIQTLQDDILHIGRDIRTLRDDELDAVNGGSFSLGITVQAIDSFGKALATTAQKQ